MQNIFENNSKVNTLFSKLYAVESINQQIRRYQEIGTEFSKHFKDSSYKYFSSSGRTEISGNHTDHNGGKVLAASISMDSVAAAQVSNNNTITMYSKGYDQAFVVDLSNLEPQAGEKGTAALLRGIAAGFKMHGLKIGGMNIYVSSDVANGSGISSSASIEMLVGGMLNEFYNNADVDQILVGKIGQFAENKYWNKPCGLLDQTTIGLGGLIYIDFKDKQNPKINQVKFDFAKANYKLLVLDTGGSHSELTNEYAQVPVEMWAVAKELGKERLVDLSYDQFLTAIPKLRPVVGDRAVLRAMHFYAENNRVDAQVEFLAKNDFDGFLNLVTESGASSWRLLQNCYDILRAKHQEIPLALALTERFLVDRKIKGAYRVHGGGFAGTILVALPDNKTTEYLNYIKPFFGEKSAMILTIREHGSICVSRMVG